MSHFKVITANQCYTWMDNVLSSENRCKIYFDYAQSRETPR